MLHRHVEQLLGKTLLRDAIVDDHGLARHLWTVVGVGLLRGHVQPEVGVPLDLLVSQLDGQLAYGEKKQLGMLSSKFRLYLSLLHRQAC
jgi:hypothetical protein